MDEAVRYFWRQRACPVRRFRHARANYGLDKISGCRRQNNFSPTSDFQQHISSVRRADKRFVDVRDFLYFVLAVFDVAALPETNFYKSLTLREGVKLNN